MVTLRLVMEWLPCLQLPPGVSMIVKLAASDRLPSHMLTTAHTSGDANKAPLWKSCQLASSMNSGLSNPSRRANAPFIDSMGHRPMLTVSFNRLSWQTALSEVVVHEAVVNTAYSVKLASDFAIQLRLRLRRRSNNRGLVERTVAGTCQDLCKQPGSLLRQRTYQHAST
jgi:hypothetical protein